MMAGPFGNEEQDRADHHYLSYSIRISYHRLLLDLLLLRFLYSLLSSVSLVFLHFTSHVIWDKKSIG